MSTPALALIPVLLASTGIGANAELPGQGDCHHADV